MIAAASTRPFAKYPRRLDAHCRGVSLGVYSASAGQLVKINQRTDDHGAGSQLNRIRISNTVAGILLRLGAAKKKLLLHIGGAVRQQRSCRQDQNVPLGLVDDTELLEQLGREAVVWSDVVRLHCITTHLRNTTVYSFFSPLILCPPRDNRQKRRI